MPSPPVILRARVEDDDEVLFRLAADLDSWEERTPRPPAPLTRAAFREQLAAHDRDDAIAEFVIEVEGGPVGRCTLFDFDVLAQNAEVGIALLPEARGHGIGTSALGQLVEFGFVRRNLHRIHLRLVASNLAAVGAYRRVGFVEEGRRREHCWVRGAWQDEVVMGLLRDEWSARSPA